jgi:hypothetical protein
MSNQTPPRTVGPQGQPVPVSVTPSGGDLIVNGYKGPAPNSPTAVLRPTPPKKDKS